MEPLLPPTCSFLLQTCISPKHASCVDGHSLHTSFESSLLFTLKSLGSSPNLIFRFRACSCVKVVRRRACFCFSFRFHFSLLSLVKVVHLKRVDGGGFDPSNFRSKVDDLDHRTTVSCKTMTYLQVQFHLVFGMSTSLFLFWLVHRWKISMLIFRR